MCELCVTVKDDHVQFSNSKNCCVVVQQLIYLFIFIDSASLKGCKSVDCFPVYLGLAIQITQMYMEGLTILLFLFPQCTVISRKMLQRAIVL